jgi:uncharacterized membrane-anchored protein
MLLSRLIALAGLFAVIGAFILKFAKVFLLFGAGAIALVAKWFGRKKDA